MFFREYWFIGGVISYQYLTERSKEAIVQMRTILGDIQKGNQCRGTGPRTELTGMRKVELTVQGLHELGQKVKELVTRYKDWETVLERATGEEM